MSLNDKLFSIASSAVEKQRKARDGRNPVSKGFDVATNKSYANDDKKVAAAALREWENSTWKPKVAAKLKQEIKTRAPHLKPGTQAYQQTYDSLFNKNYKDLQSAKAKAQQQIGTLRKPQQSQRELDNEYRTNESIRNDTVGTQAAAHAARDTVSAVGGALATGTSRLLRAPLQLAADVGENDDGGIFDRGAKALEGYEDNIKDNVYQSYGDIQQNGSFSQKLALSAVEQVPALAASFGTAGAAVKGAQLLGAGTKLAAATSYGAAGASMYPQAYLDGSDSTKDELENATPEQLASAERSQDTYKGMFDKNIKAGMSEDEAHVKARDQTISEIAEESGENVGLATLALSMLAPGVGSYSANQVAGGAVSKFGQKIFNKLAVRADSGKVAKYAIPTAVGTGIVGLNVAEEGLQEGYTDYVAQKAGVDVGVKDKIDRAQNTEAVLMGGILGGLMGGGTYVGTRNSKLHQAQDDLVTAQQAYAEVAGQIPQLQQQIEIVSPRSEEGQALTGRLNETKAALDAMAEQASKAGIPRTSLARRAPRIDPTNSTGQDFNGQVDGATEIDGQSFEDALNPAGTPAPQAEPVIDVELSEQELDAQDAQIAELIAEQEALDEVIEDGSNDKPLEKSIAAAQSWYDQQRGEGTKGLGGVVRRAAATEQDTAFAQQQEAIKGATASINDYIASERAKQQQIDDELARDAVAAKTEREKREVEQRAQQREIDRAQEDALLERRASLAQPYENETFDTTVVGADGAPFNLARFWDSTMPAAMKAKAIANAFDGQVEQNVAKSDWATMPEGVQKQLHQWMTGQLDTLRQSREGGEVQSEQPVPMTEQPQEVAPTASGLTMPVAEVSTPAATQLTDENPVINIPAPTQAKTETPAPTTEEGIYKSKPAAKAAIKKQKLDPNNVTIEQVKGGGFKIVPNTQAQAITDVAIGKDGQAKWFGSSDKAQAFISKKGLSDTHEVVSAGKSRFEIQPKAPVSDIATKPRADDSSAKPYNTADLYNEAAQAYANKDAPAQQVAVNKAKDAGMSQAEIDQTIKRVESTASNPDLVSPKPSNLDAVLTTTEKTQNDVTAETKDRFADNKLFTSDKVAAARARLKSKMGQVNSGFDPEMAIDGMTLAGAYIESGVRKFGDYAKLMIEDFGDNIKPQLLSFWEGARNWDGLDTEGMTSVADSKREYDRLKAETTTTEELSENNNDTGTSNQDNQSGTDRGLSNADQANGESRNAGRGEAELASDIPNVDGRSDGQNTDGRNEDKRSTATNERTATDDSDSGARSPRSSDGSNQIATKTPALKAKNYTVSPDFNPLRGGWQKVAERNVAIIELVQQINAENRAATESEQQTLAEYAGWGASGIKIFPHPEKGYDSKSWQALGEKLETLLTPDEYATARRTTQYAHYTPASVVSGIYNALEQFGFKGGQVLEPASGIGIFNGLMPSNLSNASSYVGLELDPMTGRIAQLLYPQSDMKMGDYVKAKLPDNHFDVAVGNPPFANITYDYGKGKAKQSFQLHDYFFAKTLDKLKPGGVMAFVTSKGTMDKNDSKARDWLASRADLVGAIRLPNTAFKDAGTGVVTDIIFLRKRVEGDTPSATAWTNTKTIDIDGTPATINEYFIDNPNMVLGRHAITSGQFGDTYTVNSDSDNLGSQIETAIAQLPKDIYNPSRGSKAEAAKVADMDYGAKSSETKEGGVYLKDGKLMKVIDGVGKPLTHRYGGKGQKIELKPKDIAFLSDYTKIRDAFKQSQRDQLDDSPNWQQSLDDLNKTYDSFVKKHGTLMAHKVKERENSDGTVTVTSTFTNKAILFLDVDSVMASALENIVDDGQGTVEKGSYLKGRSLNKPKVPKINTTQDALVYVLDSTGTPDIKRIAELANKTEQAVTEELGDQVFTNPDNGLTEMAETYLSGNVLEKLQRAEAIAKNDKSYARNVKALQEVQPKPIAPNDIASNLGAGWIPTATIKEFANEVLDATINAKYSTAAGLWDVGGYSRNSDYQTPDRTTVSLMESILNSKKIEVTYKVDDKTVVDVPATDLANRAADKIKTAFKDWLWRDSERAQTLAEYYNKTYNNIVPPTFNGDHLTLAGMSNMIKLRPHQKRGIYRVISQGDVYLNHAVGAGKTFTMISAAMEEKRLGLINKPMFVVPNHMLAQFSQEFLMLYPAANIVVADDQNFHTHNRKAFMAQAAVNNPDAIIVTHSSFKKIGVKPETQQAFLKETLKEWQDALASAKDADGDARSTSVRQLERNIEAMNTKLEALLNTEDKDTAVYFEDMGVDKLIVDEMHEFRKLSYATKQGNIKGITATGSQMASDLQMKIELIRKKNPTRSIVGASGTPVTNTMGELFSIQQYFQPKQLKKDGLHHFDGWANQFGEVVKGLEQNAAGNYEVVPRFAKFVNVPELMSRVRWFMDVLTSDQLGDVVKRPDVIGGGREIVTIPATEGFADFQKSLADRITAIRNRSGKAEKGADIILSVITDGRFGAIDPRFVDPELPSDPNSKLNRAITDIVEAYHATADNEYVTDGNIDDINGGALMMFTDIGLGEQSAASRGFDMKAWINSELIRQGVNPDHIAFMRDNKSHAKKGKLFDDMRQGRKHILIGGKDMETGVNVQKRLTHLFHLDAPWFPASVEQREGRIIRQGNQNKNVVIRAYATKGSYDSTMWGMVARKARFIAQAMNGDTTIRNMDDISEASAFEQASALSSGDPRALELAGLRQDVEALDRYYSAYQNAKFDNERSAKRSEQSVARAERDLATINDLLASHKDIETGGIIGQVGSKAFDKREDYGNAIIKAFKKLADSYTLGEHVLGTASGYNVVYNGVMLSGNNFIADADVDIPKSNDKVLFDSNDGDLSGTGLATSIVNRVNKLAEYQRQIEASVGIFKKDAENFRRRASQSFDSEIELNEKRKALADLEEALKLEAEALKAQAGMSNAPQGAPLTDADRVPAKDEQPKFSKTNPAKGATGTTSQQVIDVLQKRFGKEVVASLIKSGKLRVRSLNDFVNADGELLIPSDAEGFYHDGKVVLIADNLTPDTVVATLLHEMGGHAGIQNLLSPTAYANLMGNFEKLVESGNKYAVAAKERAEAMTGSDSEARDEYIPYLITEYAQANERGGPLAVIKRFLDRVVAGVRAWVRDNTGVQLKITPNDITQLAERMVKRLAEQSASDITIAGVTNAPAQQFSSSNVPSQQLSTVRKKYEGTDQWMKAPNGEPTKLNEKQWLQVRTPHFKAWFGDWENDAANASTAVNANGEPKIMYHGSPLGQTFNAFKGDRNGAMYFADSKDYSKDFMDRVKWWEGETAEDKKMFEVFLNVRNQFDIRNKDQVGEVVDLILANNETYLDGNGTPAMVIDGKKTLRDKETLEYMIGEDGSNWVIMEKPYTQAEIKKLGYDSYTADEGKWHISTAVYSPTQIKSATDNVGMFNSSHPDIRYSQPQFSRRYSSLGSDGKPTTAKERARDRVALAQATTMSSKFGVNLLLRRHLATPQHVALLNPIFKVFTDNVQARIAYENNEAGLVQTYLPEIWDTRLIVGKKKAAMDRVSKSIFDGTMADKVWTDDELETKFNLTPEDISFYRRARQAIDDSVLNMTVDTLSSLAKGTKLVSLPTVQKLKLAGLTPVGHNVMLQKHMTDELEKLAKGGLITPKAEARLQKQLTDVFDVMGGIAGKYDKLVEQGYAPLMRFGNYAVEVRDKTTNDLDLFELYETKGQQRKAIKDLKQRYDETKFTIGTGTLNPEGFKQFKDKGLSPETVQLFAAELGLDEDGAYQAYLKIAVSDRSALKRLIHRKKVPGYSEDMPRVLSSFVMSNARYSGRSLYNGEIERSIQNIEDGNLQNEAQKVFENMENPQEEFAQQRSMMFFYFMGFSPAFFFLNLTQPFTQTIPKLTAYAGVAKGHAYMAQAMGIIGKHMGKSAINMGKKAVGMPTPNWTGFEDNLPAWVKKEDYLRMAREGHLDPQNIYMIKGLERGKGGVASGVWGNIQASAGWFAEVSESINRRSTMIAAMRVAKDMGDAKLKAKGFDSKYDFAVSIIQQTQGIYNKANRSGLARGNGKLGQYGPLILVFKQFTINYAEQMIRHGRDKEAKSLAVALAWQFGLAGMLGLPFADDLRDIFEGLAYRIFGKAFNLPDYLEGLLGKSNADALMYGLASEKGRIDLYGRSSLGNIIPGTDVVRPGPTDWAEILGASSGFYESFFSAASMAADGQYKDAVVTASPRFVRDLASGAEIAATGSYRNTKGDKIMDLDKTDAAIKALQFNPANNARPGRDRSNAYNMKNMLKAKTDYFSKGLAEAMYQENDERVDELYNEMDAWNERNAEHFNVDIEKIEKSADKRVERKDFGSAERQNIQDSLALRQEDLAGT
ncbi:PLxRFG domain-containing protein [Psychrobacter vallis]|uniref:PLxRFG domain-containing protein n=1 Tax=Psychrobacter vallis TaxID=248451 RepID=UPI00191A8689|nr:PLxRFG domain-containing protein [Psychrobacter vallis]